MKITFSVLMSVCLLTASLLAACTPAGPHTYQDPAFSFTYPGDWQTMAELFGAYEAGREYYGLGFSEQVMVTSAQEKGEAGVYFAVATRPLAAGERLEDVFHDTYAKISAEIQNASEATIPIAGQQGYLMSYRRPWGEPWWQFDDVWLEKDGVIYLLSAHAYQLEEQRETIDAILESFKFE